MNTIVLGSLDTDFVATGVERFPRPGEHVYGRELKISPGGKARNIADMAARLLPKNGVAMIGKTVRDPYGLWKVPVDALAEAGVNTDHIVIADYATTQKLPGITLIPIDQHGNNQIFTLPGISHDLSIADVDKSEQLFEIVGKNSGVLVLTLECSPDTAIHAIELANKYNLKVMFDPGGIRAAAGASRIVQTGVYLIKPSEHEAKVLTGVDVTDLASASQAAEKLRKQGVENVLITAGAHGAYMFAKNIQKHIPVPGVQAAAEKDETGCGDQTMAALCAAIQNGKTLEQAAELAVRAGTMQFYRHGVKPITTKELGSIW